MESAIWVFICIALGLDIVLSFIIILAIEDLKNIIQD